MKWRRRRRSHFTMRTMKTQWLKSPTANMLYFIAFPRVNFSTQWMCRHRFFCCCRSVSLNVANGAFATFGGILENPNDVWFFGFFCCSLLFLLCCSFLIFSVPSIIVFQFYDCLGLCRRRWRFSIFSLRFLLASTKYRVRVFVVCIWRLTPRWHLISTS